jgi:hypothetical protein
MFALRCVAPFFRFVIYLYTYIHRNSLSALTQYHPNAPQIYTPPWLLESLQKDKMLPHDDFPLPVETKRQEARAMAMAMTLGSRNNNRRDSTSHAAPALRTRTATRATSNSKPPSLPQEPEQPPATTSSTMTMVGERTRTRTNVTRSARLSASALDNNHSKDNHNSSMSRTIMADYDDSEDEDKKPAPMIQATTLADAEEPTINPPKVTKRKHGSSDVLATTIREGETSRAAIQGDATATTTFNKAITSPSASSSRRRPSSSAKKTKKHKEGVFSGHMFVMIDTRATVNMANAHSQSHSQQQQHYPDGEVTRRQKFVIQNGGELLTTSRMIKAWAKQTMIAEETTGQSESARGAGTRTSKICHLIVIGSLPSPSSNNDDTNNSNSASDASTSSDSLVEDVLRPAQIRACLDHDDKRTKGVLPLPSPVVELFHTCLAQQQQQQDLQLLPVNSVWLDTCVSEQQYCDPHTHSQLFQPQYYQHVSAERTNDDDDKSSKLLRVAVSGFVGSQRRGITHFLQSVLGAAYTDGLNKKSNTHLICLDATGAKYERAVKWKIHVVSLDWLFYVARHGWDSDTKSFQEAQFHPSSSIMNIDISKTTTTTTGSSSIADRPNNNQKEIIQSNHKKGLSPRSIRQDSRDRHKTELGEVSLQPTETSSTITVQRDQPPIIEEKDVKVLVNDNNIATTGTPMKVVETNTKKAHTTTCTSTSPRASRRRSSKKPTVTTPAAAVAAAESPGCTDNQVLSATLDKLEAAASPESCSLAARGRGGTRGVVGPSLRRGRRKRSSQRVVMQQQQEEEEEERKKREANEDEHENPDYNIEATEATQRNAGKANNDQGDLEATEAEETQTPLPMALRKRSRTCRENQNHDHTENDDSLQAAESQVVWFAEKKR